MNFTFADLLWAQRRQRYRRVGQTLGDPRAAMETTIRSTKHPSGGRLPVQGFRRVTDMLIGAAAMVTIWAILRFQRRKRRLRTPEQTENRSEAGITSIQEE